MRTMLLVYPNADRRNVAVWNYILGIETAAGSYFMKSDGRLYMFVGFLRRIFHVPFGHPGEDITAYLNGMYGITLSNPMGRAIYSHLHNYALNAATKTELRRFAVYNTTTHTAYLSSYDGRMWRVDGGTPECVTNGDDDVFFADDDGGVTVEPDIGPHGILLDKLVDLNYTPGLGGITPEQQRMALTIWIFALAFPDLMPTKPLLMLEGTQGCITGDAFISFSVRTADGKRCNAKGGTLAKLYERFHNLSTFKGDQPSKRRKNAQFFVSSMLDSGRIIQQRVVDVVDSGKQECVHVTTESGLSITCTPDHPFATPTGYVAANQLRAGSSVLVHQNTQRSKGGAGGAKRVERPDVYVKHHPVAPWKTVRVASGTYRYRRLRRARAAYEAKMNGLSLGAYLDRLNEGALDGLSFLPKEVDVHHRDENPLNDDPTNLELLSHADHAREHARDNQNLAFVATIDIVTKIERVGVKQTYDITVENEPRNFVANKFVVHNSGKSASVQLLQLALLGVSRPMILSKNKEDDFGVMLLRSPIAVFDNTDSYIEWVPDAICAYTTQGYWAKRKLYTDADEITIKPHAFVAVASKNPASFRREDVADRQIIIRLERRDNFRRFEALRHEILDMRPQLLGEYIWYVNEIVEYLRTTNGDAEENETTRMADFAAFARAVGAVLHWSRDDVSDLMTALASERDAFICEEDPLVELLHKWIVHRARGYCSIGREVTLFELYNEVKFVADSDGIAFYKSARMLAQKIRSPHVAREFDVEINIRDRQKTYKFWRKDDPRLTPIDGGLSSMSD